MCSSDLIDELSEIVNLETSEEDMGNNVSNFSVRINGQTLVSSYSYNTLETVARTDKKNYSDAEGLYDVQWNSGQKFDMYSTSLSGHLKDLRNNSDLFRMGILFFLDLDGMKNTVQITTCRIGRDFRWMLESIFFKKA